MSCLFPGAPDLATFWSNIVGGKDAIRDVTDREWKVDDYYDPNAASFGMTYSKRAGFISEHADFDPLQYGVMPSSVAGSDPDQFLTLKVAHEAMADAGYLDRPLDKDRAEVILGRIGSPGAGSLNLIQQSKTVNEVSGLLRGLLPEASSDLVDQVVAELKERLVTCNSDTIPGAMPNVLAGRIAAKLGFRGRNLLIDAACASSMVAVETAVNDLLSGRCDFALAGGLHVNSSAVFFQMFCGLGALSRSDNIRPFDEAADGTILGEGIGIICLKRFEDAIADGDRIYATICGIASSSDGHGGSVLSPSLEGEALAMQKAYTMAGVSPRTVGLLEAHGTGTPAGDVVEMQAVKKVFADSKTDEHGWCAVGSVKSMIGHCQSASAVAGIIKTALALYHKILPPTLNVSRPNTKIDWSTHPCYINTHARPWIHPLSSDHPRRAAVSAFGFGGINSHVVLEELVVERRGHALASSDPEHQESLIRNWPSEIFTFEAGSVEALIQETSDLADYLQKHSDTTVDLKDLAFTVNCKRSGNSIPSQRLAIISSTPEELQARLDQAANALESGKPVHEPDKGVYFSTSDTVVGGKLGFVYPGLGSAYTGMLSDLCMHFPEVRWIFDIVDTIAIANGDRSQPSKIIFPHSAGQESLAAADFAVVAVLLAEYAMYLLLDHLDIHPDVLMGCSTGEFAAITTSGAVDVLPVAELFYGWSTRVARSVPADDLANLRSLRILASADTVLPLIAGKDVYLSADLGERHILVTGTEAGTTALAGELARRKIAMQALPSAIPYHTPLVKNLIDSNDDSVQSVEVKKLMVPTWACSTGTRYPDDQAFLRSMFTDLFARPVKLRETIDSMYEEGVRSFVEVGPNGVLSTLVGGILADRPHIAVPTNLAWRPAVTQIHHVLAALFTQWRNPDFEFLYGRRAPVRIDLHAERPKETSSLKLNLCYTKLEVSPELRIEIEPGCLQHVPEHGVEYADAAAPEEAPQSENVLGAFFSTSSSFYSRMAATQERIMTAFLSNGDDKNRQDAGALRHSDGTSDLAFVNRFEIRPGSGATEAVLEVDLQNDLYLLDHAVGGAVSAAGMRVHLIPLMVSLEIMAQAALVHAGGGIVVRVEQVKAYKRIFVEGDGVRLRLIASGGSEKVSVQMFDEHDSSSPILQASFVFGRAYDTSRNQPEIAVSGSAPGRLRARSQLYTPRAMFHGPRMQSVVSLGTVGNRCIAGCVDSREAADWMPSQPVARCLLHPMLLDNGSQLVLFYLYERGLESTALLPFFIESIEFFSPWYRLPQLVSASASLQTLTDRATEAKVEVLDSNNRAWMRIDGINSRRIMLSPEWKSFVNDPINSSIGKRLPVNSEISTRCVLQEVDRDALPADEAVLDWCLDYLLTRTERKFWRNHLKFEKRKLEWLLGRIAAKESIRNLVSERFQVALGPLDIEVANDESRRPIVTVSHQGLPDVLVSISHSDGVGVALSSIAGDGSPGVDFEIIEEREPEFAHRFLATDELRYLENCPPEAKQSELTRMWSAKESAFKSLGGIVEMTSLTAQTPIHQTDVILLCQQGVNATTIKVYSETIGNRVRSYTLS